MGKNAVKFRCHHCGHCCTDVVCLPTPWDVIRLVRHTGEDPREFLEFLTPDEITGVTKSDPTWLECNGKRHIMALRRDKSGCHFLHKKTKHCTAYEHRPLLCRLYPFKLHETKAGEFSRFSLHQDVGCPRHRDGCFDTQPLYELYLDDSEHQTDYNDLVRVFNRDDHKDRVPQDFIKMFIKGL